MLSVTQMLDMTAMPKIPGSHEEEFPFFFVFFIYLFFFTEIVFFCMHHPKVRQVVWNAFNV